MSTPKFRKLTKDKVYTVFNRSGVCVFRGAYLGRYYNGVTLQWYYHFKSLDEFTSFTPATCTVEVWS